MAFLDVFVADQNYRKVYGVTPVPNPALQTLMLEYCIPRLVLTPGEYDINSQAKDALKVLYHTINMGPSAPDAIANTLTIVLPSLCSLDFGSGSSVLSVDVEVIGVGSGLAVKDGDIFKKGSDLTKVLTQLVQKTNPPTYKYPSGTLIVLPATMQEVGKDIYYTLDPHFSKNDGGTMGEVTLYAEDVLIRTQSDLSDYVYENQVVTLGNRTFKEVIQYAKGPIKDDNFGNPMPGGRIPAGFITETRVVKGGYYAFYGPFGSAPPTDGQVIRNYLSTTFSDSFILNTYDSALVHVIACPKPKQLLEVIDLDALNLIITDDYVLSTTVTTIPDAKGANVPFNVYVSENAAAYPLNHRHDIKLG